MPELEELMAMQGGGGGAPQGGAPPQMPPGGGDPRMAQAMQMKLQQLMQDPVARAGMQAHMQGGDPRMAGAQLAMQGGGGGINRPSVAMQGPRGQEVIRGGDAPLNPYARDAGDMATGPQGGRSSPATDQDLYEVQEANQGVRGNLPPVPDEMGMTGYGEEMSPMKDPRQTPMPNGPGSGRSPETDMISEMMDRKGMTFDGTNAPTANDIERLREAPTDSMVEAFDEKFGDGAAAKYMNDTEQDSSPEDAEHYK
jgi:hypothetical protein